jgi:hypothetical protein
MTRAAVTPVTRHSLGDRVAVTVGPGTPLDRVRPTARRPKVPAALLWAAFDRAPRPGNAVGPRRSVTPSEGGCSR